MKLLRFLPRLLLLCLAGAGAAHGQALPTADNGFQNRFSYQGAPVVLDTNTIPVGNSPSRPAYDLQWQGGTAYGGFQTTRILGANNEVVAGSPSTNAGATTLIVPSYTPPNAAPGQGVRLTSVIIGRPMVLQTVSYGLGAEIPRPLVNSAGQDVPTDFYLEQPANAFTDAQNTVPNDRFYWSPHARKVYGTQPGVINIVWRERVSGALFTRTYVISTSPAKPEKKIFWTEKGFNGPKVSVPESRVSAVNIVYNSLFRSTAESEFVSPYELPPDPKLQLPPEVRTLWYDPMDKLIHAYNREGRAFIEYLGNLKADGVSREQLGYEVVNVIKETRPVTLKTDIGEPVLPPADPDADGNLRVDPALSARVIAGMAAAGTPYLFEHLSLGGTRSTLYAVRQTAPGVFLNGIEQQISNEVLIYWQERGEMGILWPKHYVGYIHEWPASLSRYSLYARPDVTASGGLQAAQDTGVQLDSANKPILTYQDDPTNQQAVLAPGNIFYTKVSPADPTNRALIRYTRDEDIWFERVFSRLDSTYDTRQVTAVFNPETGLFSTGFTGIGNVSLANPANGFGFVEGQDYTVDYLTGVIRVIPGSRISGTAQLTYQVFSSTPPGAPVMFDATIGQRIEPPPGSADTLVGFIHQSAGTAFNAETYKNPFITGFSEAAKGAIIGVNALPNNDRLEVWWYRKSKPPGEKITSTLWPAMVQRFRLRWPSAPPEIVLASNRGSDDLPSMQANGKIYFQNDSSQPGFNPNEEHAMMINGRAWALRDDLNLATSSQPYVLLQYTEADSRPAMAVFKVLRENDTYTFDYDATAGVILQAPMPLPVLPVPIRSNRSVANYEVEVTTPPDPVPNFSASADAALSYYQRFTYADRKGAHWVYRGPHEGNAVTPEPSFSMRYFYQTQPGFFFPGRQTQPALGTIVPYLRPEDPGTPGNFIGDAVTGDPLDIVFTPKWPASVPELRIGETLTTAKLGLPAVRGQTSAQLIYQQSLANDATPELPIAQRRKSARLFDPTRAKTFAFAAPTAASGLKKIPGSIKTSNYIGKTYFPNLPPHLSERLFFDPARGPSGSLVFIGVFKNETVGEKYLLLNVMSAADLADAKALVDSGDDDKDLWHAAIDSLSTTMETFYENPAKRGTFIVDTAKNVSIAPGDLAEVEDDDTAVDSYAVAASGGGEGYVVLAAGNGRAFTPDGEPVSFHVFRVTPPLYRGQLKAINSANPLDEKLTLQHTGDFAGHPEEYDFEWRYAPPIDGKEPLLYTFERTLLVGDSNGTAPTEWRLFKNPAADFEKYRAAGANLAGSTAVSLPSGQVVINDGNGSADHGTSRPYAILRRTFDATQRPLRLFVSALLQPLDGAAIYVNGARVAAWNVPGQENSFTTSSPGGDFSPLQRLFEIPASVLRLGTNANVITAELYSGADAGHGSSLNFRLEGSQETENLTAWLPLSLTPDDTPGELDGSATGKVRHVIKGSSLLTLTDNYFIMRYRPRLPDNAAYVSGAGWSKWVNPQLAEGWIKRALAGINPFQQRVTDLFNNPVNTDVSLVSQAGKRWEGDITLNLANINEFGLIEIYETILRRGKMLSIEGNPPISFAGANDALLLAAGYLSDLYMLVGNEAFADAANPTIAFGLDNGITFGDVATSLFAFKGQQGTVLDEELALLRGRDDFLAPGTRVAPVYNRLFWNYTRGIDAGEAIYALNYNIRDMDADGLVGPDDAAKLFPQAHGDAYGHYLTALTGYYGLLANPNFSWTPRAEAVTVLGQAVQVDYMDERKFASAAAALTRSASHIADLTYRQAFSASENAGWSELRDGRTNGSTGRVRSWGADEWASRAGQGAYFHWLTANSLLPAIDPDPTHEGIQKIDRTTVPELAEIVTQAAAIQQTLDNMDARLNPLGLSRGALAFDISPTEIDSGKTHYEQVYGRAVGALQNAVSAFNNAKSSTEFLRRQDDTLATQRSAIEQQERAFENQLIEIYGTPYTDDIGPGRPYVQGYAGPDLLHSMYVEITEDLAGGNFTPIDESEYTLWVALDPAVYEQPLPFFKAIFNESGLPGVKMKVPFTLGAISGDLRKPTNWTGRRASPGRMQTAVSDLLLARQNLFGALYDYNRLTEVMTRQITLYRSAVTAHDSVISLSEKNHSRQTALESVNTALDFVIRTIDGVKNIAELVGDTVADGLPKVVGLANDVLAPARALTKGAGIAVITIAEATQLVAETEKNINAQLMSSFDRLMAIDIDNANWTHENRQLLSGLRDSLQDFIDKAGAIDSTLRRFDQAQRDLYTLQAQGDRVQRERQVFRQRSAAIIQGYRTRDFAFRAFRNEALEKYKTLFDLASKYTYLAARSYDYETGLLNPDGSTAARRFYEKIVRARALGVVSNGQPQIGGSSTGDPGLSGVLAQMSGDWSVARTRLGFNNPDRYRTTFSLRTENFRFLAGVDGDQPWRDKLASYQMNDITGDPDVRRYCMQVADANGQAVPGIVIPFETTITTGANFFGQSLAGGDKTFTPSSFATKIRSSGIAFSGYVGMESPTSTSGALTGIGATSPPDPSTGFTDPQALSATPYVYLIPAGSDTLRAPPLGDSNRVRRWEVEDQAIPLPFNIANSDFSTRPGFVSADSLSEPAFTLRKHQAFRAVPDGTNFSGGLGFSNSRLIGRSVWNTRWKIVIPGNTLLADPEQGVETFLKTVKDIKLHLETYSYSGN